MYCSISGSAPREPVFSKTGYVFERRLIEEHIQRTGTCPVTNEPLTENDLSDIKVNRVVKPRTVATTSIPAMLQTFQNEWDALMVETYELRKQLDQCRTELATALYKQDAAERTIARLVRERDVAMAEARAGGGAARAIAPSEDAGGAEAMEIEGGGLTSAQESLLQDTATSLVAQRKVREVSADLSAPDAVEKYKEVASHSVIAASKKGLSALAREGSMLAVGAVNGTVALWDSSASKVMASLKGHSKAVSAVAFVPNSSSLGAVGALVTGSLDRSVRVWTAPPQGFGYKALHTLSSLHSGEVTGISVHPCGAFAVSSSRDQTWALIDLEAGSAVYTVGADLQTGAHASCAFHPDGLLLATATDDSAHQLRLWDIKAKENVICFQGHAGSINSIAFSENGFHLATGSEDQCVKLWDLRNLAQPVFATEETGAPVKSVAFDHSGRYLAAGGKDIQVYSVQDDNSTSHVTRLAGHKGTVTALVWGDEADALYSISTDKTLKVFSAK